LARLQQLVVRVQKVVAASVRVEIVVAETVEVAVNVAEAGSAEAADVVTHNIHDREN
jgi:hypothetical protein